MHDFLVINPRYSVNSGKGGESPVVSSITDFLADYQLHTLQAYQSKKEGDMKSYATHRKVADFILKEIKSEFTSTPSYRC